MNEIKIIDHSARLHSRISPSGLKPLQICPGYENEKGESKASERGTRLHEVMETGIIPENFPEVDRPTAELVLDIIQQEDAKSQYEALKEVELDLTPLNLEGFEKGNTDRIIVIKANESHEPTHVDMVDFKFGQVEVDPIRDNLQFKAYSLGVWLMFPTVELITAKMIQPAYDKMEEYTFSRERDFEMLKTQVGAVVRRRNKYLATLDESMLRTDDTYCGYCAIQATCPIWQKYMVRLANEANILSCTVVPIENLEDPETADPAELIRALRWKKPMEEYLKKLSRFALKVYEAGRIDGGLTLVEKPSDSKVTDPIGVRNFLKIYGVTTEELLSVSKVSVEGIREIVANRAATGEKGKTADEAVKALTDAGLIENGFPIRYVQLKRGKAALGVQ